MKLLRVSSGDERQYAIFSSELEDDITNADDSESVILFYIVVPWDVDVMVLHN